MNTKHTPAPWNRGKLIGFMAKQHVKPEFRKKLEANELTYIVSDQHEEDEGKSRQLVCTLNQLHPDYEANANLIAAAPELLAVIKQAVEDIRGEWNTDFLVAKMDAVIAKAEGVATGNTAQS